MKTYVLYNPKAGSGAGRDAAMKLRAVCAEELEFRDITAIESYADFFDRIGPSAKVILAGGDGTLNRFLNDTAEAMLPNPIYYYAVGGGNDFLRDLGLEKGAEPVCIDLYRKKLPLVEAGGHTYRFLNGVGYGIDGYCCEKGDALRDAGGKKINYTAIAIKGLLFHYKPANAVVTVDGVRHEFRKVWLAPTMNGRFYGGGMMPTPAQDRLGEDGAVSVMVMQGSGKLRTLAIFPSIFSGRHVSHAKCVHILNGHEITVRFDQPRPLQIDGECFNSCLYLAVWAEGKHITTLEGLTGPNGELSDIQQAFMDETAIQCGFCIPGFIMTAAEILDRKVYYTDDQLRKLLSGHLCRCTGYENIFKAVKKTMLRRLGMLDDPFLNT